MNLITKFSISVLVTASTTLPVFAENSNVAVYRVSGWQNSLVQSSPNLRNFYWEPMTRRVINTTHTTGRGAIQAALPDISSQRKPRTAPTSATSTMAVVVNSQKKAQICRTIYKGIPQMQTSTPMAYPEVDVTASGSSLYSGGSTMRRTFTVSGKLARQ